MGKEDYDAGMPEQEGWRPGRVVRRKITVAAFGGNRSTRPQQVEVERQEAPRQELTQQPQDQGARTSP